MDRARIVAKNITSLFFSGVAAQLLGFVGTVYLARILGSEGFGQISFALSIMTYFTAATAGLSLVGTRGIARDIGRTNQLVGTVLTMRVVLTMILLVGLGVFLAFVNMTESRPLIALYGLGLVPLALSLDWVFQGWERMEFTGLSRLIIVGFYVFLVFIFVRSNQQVLWVPIFQLVSNVVNAAILFVVFVRLGGRLQFASDRLAWTKVLTPSVSIGLSSLMVQFIWYMDITTVGIHCSKELVGNYAAAHKLILAILLANGAYQDAIFPVLSSCYTRSLEALRRVQDHTARLMFTAGIPMAVGGMLTAGPLVRLVYGDEYTDSAQAFQILIWMASFVLINSVYARGLWAGDRQNVYFYIVVGQAIVSIGLNLGLVPWLGAIGAALARLAAEGVALPFYHREFSRIVKVPMLKYLWRPLIASIPMALILGFGLLARWHVLLLIVIGLAVYGGVIFLIGGVTRRDIRLVYYMLFGRADAPTGDM